jgi:metallo-beta-lactamase class B
MQKYKQGLPVLWIVFSMVLGACQPQATAQAEITATANEAAIRTDILYQDTTQPIEARTEDLFTPMPLDLSAELHIREVQPGAYEITHDFPWPANSLLVEMANGDFVWAGSTYTPEAANQVLDWLEATFGQRKLIAINTGYHVDNLGGNAALIDRGIPVYGSELTVQLLQEKGQATRLLLIDMMTPSQAAYAQAYSEIPYLPPTEIFPIEEGLHLSFGDEQVEVIYPGPSQAPDKVAVYFPQRKLLFGSCMILSTDKVGNTADADIPSWITAIHQLEAYEVEVVVPGHGDRLDVELIQHTLDVLQSGQ